MNPDDAVRAHLDLGARLSLAMHFATFPLTDEAIDAPIAALDVARRAHGVPIERFRVPGSAKPSAGAIRTEWPRVDNRVNCFGKFGASKPRLPFWGHAGGANQGSPPAKGGLRASAASLPPEKHYGASSRRNQVKSLSLCRTAKQCWSSMKIAADRRAAATGRASLGNKVKVERD